MTLPQFKHPLPEKLSHFLEMLLHLKLIYKSQLHFYILVILRNKSLKEGTI